MPLIAGTSLSPNTPDVVLRNVPCSVGTAQGDWVRIDETLEIAIPAQADAKVNSLVFGIVEEKSSPTSATIRTSGLSSNVFAGLAVNEEYVLSHTTSGAMGPRSTTIPTGAGTVIAPLGLPLNSTQFLVRIQVRMVRS